MKKLILILLSTVVLAPALVRAEDEPFSQDDFNTSPNPYQRRGRRQTPVETREERDSGSDRFERRNPAPNTRRLRDEAVNYRGELPWWNPKACNNALGFEASSPGSTSILGTGIFTYGGWVSDVFGVDVFFGFSRSAGDAKQDATTNFNPTAKTSSTTTIFTGRNRSSNVTLGAYLKFRAYYNSWFTLHLGPMLSFSPSSRTSSPTGTVTDSTPNTDKPTTHTITETSTGAIDETRGTLVSVGPRIGAEFYLKWIPHLALGMSTGILAVTGGNTTEVTNTSSKTTTITDGVAADPGPVPTTTHTVTTTRGLEGTTFGLGGTTFSLVGNFTLRYIW